MAELQIQILLSFLIFFIFSRNIWVRIIKKEKLKIEIHLPIFALVLTNKHTGVEEKKKKSLSPIGTLSLADEVIRQLRSCRVSLGSLIIPQGDAPFNASAFLRPIAKRNAVYTIIAFFKSRLKYFDVEKNAITISPDVSHTQFYITVKLRFFKLINLLWILRRYIYRKEAGEKCQKTE